MIINLLYLPKNENYFFYDTYSDIYNGFLKKNNLETKYLFYEIDSNNINFEIDIIIKEIKEILKKNNNNILLITNNWLIDKISKKLKDTPIISLNYSNYSNYSLNENNNSKELKLEKLFNILTNKKIKIENEIDYILNNNLIDTKFDNIKLNKIYKKFKKIIISKNHCTNNKNLINNKNFENINLPNDIKNWRGCSFCQEHSNIEEEIKLDNIKKQIELTIKNNSEINKFILNDMIFLKYFEDIIKYINNSNFKKIEIYIQSRPDILNNQFQKINKILQELNENKIKIYFYLIGFENFSQNTLNLLNKNLEVKDNIKCIEHLTYLENHFPKIVNSRTGSHGFIMFTPWTTIEDIKINLEYAKKYNFKDFCSNYQKRFLRITQDIPLYHKAKDEGLLVDKNEEENKKGYEKNYIWKFKDKRVEKLLKLKNIKY